MDYITNAFSWGFDKTVGLFLPGWDAPEDDGKGYTMGDCIKDMVVPESLELLLFSPVMQDERSTSVKNIKEKQYLKLSPNIQKELYEKARRDGDDEKMKFYRK